MKLDHCEHHELRTCPKCGKHYWEYPATSREDNETLICPDCGTREALAGMGISPEEREQILAIDLLRN